MKQVPVYNPRDVDVRKMFNDIAPKYDFLNHFLSAGIDKCWRRKTIRLLKPYNPKQILDIATGTGDLAIKALSLNPDLVTGVDISEEMLKIAERDAKQKKIKAIFFKADIGKEKLPFASNFFDYAIFISTLHCIETAEARKKALEELYRVLKKGGEAVISVWKKEAMIETWKNKKASNFNFDAAQGKELFVNWRKDGITYHRYYYFYDEKELENLLKKAGFKILKKNAEENKHSKKNIVFYVRK